jgi:hypothetical protein
MVRRKGPPSQGWKTFLRNEANGIAAMDLFVVQTVLFRLLMGRTQGTLMRSRGDRDRSRVSDGKCLHNQVRDRIGL